MGCGFFPVLGRGYFWEARLLRKAEGLTLYFLLNTLPKVLAELYPTRTAISLMLYREWSSSS